MRHRTLLGATGLSVFGVAFSWAVLTLSGVRHFLERLTTKWDLGWYPPAFFVLLTLVVAAYFRWRQSGTFIKDVVIGGLVGYLAGAFVVILSSLLQYGIEGFVRGLRIGGTSYLILIVGVALFPLCSWLYGALAIGCGGLIERHLLSGPDHSSNAA